MNRSTHLVRMAIVQEFDNGVIMYGLCKVQPEQQSNREAQSNSHNIDAEESYGSFTPGDAQSNCQAEVEPPQLPQEVEIPKVQEEEAKEVLLQKEQDLQEEEHNHQPQSMLELLNNSCDDPQPLKEEAAAKGNSSGRTEDSESDRTQSDPELEHFAASQAPVLPVPQLPAWKVLPPGSKAKGVSFHRKNKQWEAHLWIRGRQLRNRKKKGVQIFMGNYRTEDEAKQAHDRAAIKFEVRTSGRRVGRRVPKPYPLNFHESAHADFIAEHKDWSHRDFLWKLRRYSLKFSSGKSNMKGVTVRERFRKGRRITPSAVSGPETSTSTSMLSTLRYEAKIAKTDGRKMTCSIGTYASEEEAGKAYDRALLFLKKDKSEVEQWHVITNFRPSIYTKEEILEAGSKLDFK